ncbi:MAG: S46 family peptidase [Bacteroidales bacterium]|nr:S46 family peptidase [Bacteroidales bacterium]
MKKALTLTLSLLISLALKADEGMWLINAIDNGLLQKMQDAGLVLDAEELYSESGVSLKDAVVSLDFGCSGSIVSSEGLLITNHHCAYSDIHGLSTPEKNYLEEGFWAMSRDEEKHIKGKGVQFLRLAVDITDEVNGLIAKQPTKGGVSRKTSFHLEKKYKEDTGLEASLVSLWKGSRYYMFLYEEYKDVRLVAAPPVSIAAFGGDIDNWEWPQQKGDFALYRVYMTKDGRPSKEYSPENVPLVPRRFLQIKKEGVSKGDYAMVMGYPFKTSRYLSSWGVESANAIQNRLNTLFGRPALEIMKKWMDSDPVVRLHYDKVFFSRSNAIELYEGEIEYCARYKVAKYYRKRERELQKWIDSDPARKAQWGSLLKDMDMVYTATDPLKARRWTFSNAFINSTRLFQLSNKILNNNEFSCSDLCFPLERELLECAIGIYLKECSPEDYTDAIKDAVAKWGKDAGLITSGLWNASFLRDSASIALFRSESHPEEDYLQDPIIALLRSSNVGAYNKQISNMEDSLGLGSISSLERKYTAALHQMALDKGRPDYPDASACMRLTFGHTGDLKYPGRHKSWNSKVSELLAKVDSAQHDYNVTEPFLSELGTIPDMPADFIFDGDITGGNSGSPVLSADGELIGLAFDSNKEGLAGNYYFHSKYNKAVCVDIRYVLWIIAQRAPYLLEELGK